MANIKITDYDDSYGTRLVIPAAVGSDTVIKCEIADGWGIKELHVPESLTSGVEFSGDCSSIIRIIAKDGDCVLSKLAGATFSPKAIIYANSGGSAETFANDNGIAFVPLGIAPFTPKEAFTYNIIGTGAGAYVNITDYNTSYGSIINIPPFIDGLPTDYTSAGDLALLPVIHRITIPNQNDSPVEGVFSFLLSIAPEKITDLVVRRDFLSSYSPGDFAVNQEFMIFAPINSFIYTESVFLYGLQGTPIEI